jgi:hypothetical protein
MGDLAVRHRPPNRIDSAQIINVISYMVLKTAQDVD